MKKSKPEDHVQYHKDGSVWARGQTIDGVATGYWEWFRKDGVRMRSGYFEFGEQVGQWTTYEPMDNIRQERRSLQGDQRSAPLRRARRR